MILNNCCQCFTFLPMRPTPGSMTTVALPNVPSGYSSDIRCVRCRDSLGTAAITAATGAWSERRREYRALLRQKRESFWKAKVTSERSSPQQLWRSVDVLLGRDQVRSSPSITAEAMCTHSLMQWSLVSALLLQTPHRREAL